MTKPSDDLGPTQVLDDLGEVECVR